MTSIVWSKKNTMQVNGDQQLWANYPFKLKRKHCPSWLLLIILMTALPQFHTYLNEICICVCRISVQQSWMCWHLMMCVCWQRVRTSRVVKEILSESFPLMFPPGTSVSLSNHATSTSSSTNGNRNTGSPGAKVCVCVCIALCYDL